MTSLALAPAPTAAEIALVQLEDLRATLAAPELNLDEALGARDKAETLRAYATSARLGLDVANQATELRIRSERKAGALLREILANRRALPNGTLDRAGISAQQSSDWMAVSQLPDSEFELRIEATRRSGRQLTIVAFVRAARQYLRQPGKGGNGPASPTLNALRKALALLRGIKVLRTPAEVDAARAVVAIGEAWAAELEPHQQPARPGAVTREVTCLLCGRPRPPTRPGRCQSCGGAWFNA